MAQPLQLYLGIVYFTSLSSLRHFRHLHRYWTGNFKAPLPRPHGDTYIQQGKSPKFQFTPIRSPRTHFPLGQDPRLVGKGRWIRLSLTYTPFCCLGLFIFETSRSLIYGEALSVTWANLISVPSSLLWIFSILVCFVWHFVSFVVRCWWLHLAFHFNQSTRHSESPVGLVWFLIHSLQHSSWSIFSPPIYTRAYWTTFPGSPQIHRWKVIRGKVWSGLMCVIYLSLIGMRLVTNIVDRAYEESLHS